MRHFGGGSEERGLVHAGASRLQLMRQSVGGGFMSCPHVMRRTLPYTVIATLSLEWASPALNTSTPVLAAQDSAPVALTHVTAIDGTGGPSQPDMTVIIAHGEIVGF